MTDYEFEVGNLSGEAGRKVVFDQFRDMREMIQSKKKLAAELGAPADPNLRTLDNYLDDYEKYIMAIGDSDGNNRAAPEPPQMPESVVPVGPR
jgi:hypothetical protein